MKQVKAQLAKLLAEENITVRHNAKASTASFDVQNRILTLPVWKEEMTEDVYDLLTGHEVGHALWTPVDGWKTALDEGVNKNILNIVEDPRVDRKIKTRYPGLVKAYILGYRHLMEKGFFGDIEFSSMNVLDRLNMHFKGGASMQVPFDETEEWMVEIVAACETFDDVIEAAKKIQMAYAENEQTQDMMSMDSVIYGGEEYDFEEGDGESFGSDDMEGEEVIQAPMSMSVSEDDVDTQDFDAAGSHAVENDEVNTQEEYENKKQDLVKNESAEIFYIGLPKPILKNLIIPYKTCRNEIADVIKGNYEAFDKLYERGLYLGDDLSQAGINHSYKKFRQQSMKIVNYMVKEFERKKAADEYKRTSIDKTGMLNVNRLHAYKYSDDLFLKRAIVHDGKNHGMVMLVDWSASMTHNMEHTIKQLLSMIWFCNKVGIPYEVYAFTNCYRMPDKFLEGTDHKITQLLAPGWEYKHGDAYFGTSAPSDFRLLNLVSSRMSAKDLNQQLQQLFLLGTIWTRAAYSAFDMKGYSLGSTPLVEAMVAMQHIVPNFRNYYKLDKVNFICLTDGEANSSIGMVKDEYNTEDRRDYMPIPNRAKIVFDDPLTRKVYHLDGETRWRRFSGEDQTTFLVNLLRQRFGVKTIGIFLDGHSKAIARRTLEKYLGWYSMNRDLHTKVRKDARRDGFATITTAGFNEYYIVPLGSMIIQEDSGLPFEDGELATVTKGKLKSIFSKAQKRKFGNRVLANRMMDLVA